MKKRTTWPVIAMFLVAGLLATGAVLAPLLAKEGAAAGSVTLKVLNPRGESEPPPNLAISGRVTDLAGKKIGLYWLGKPDGDAFFDRVQKLLEEKFPTAKILRYTGAFDIGDGLAAKVAKEVDTFIYGVGD
ncbi:MAG TPA: hypothetical protein VLZ03_11750 [Thermodesulfobacteriota bacterium]|nr:hypothetical protein [Thermodesulfobacteriota bacterium]